jgi:hypothetical protein
MLRSCYHVIEYEMLLDLIMTGWMNYYVLQQVKHYDVLYIHPFCVNKVYFYYTVESIVQVNWRDSIFRSNVLLLQLTRCLDFVVNQTGSPGTLMGCYVVIRIDIYN